MQRPQRLQNFGLCIVRKQWSNFEKVLDRANLACKNSGYEVIDHFAEVGKTIEMPKSATKQVIDYELSRYACYLIVQNGDPRKDVIALGQTYFAIQNYNLSKT